MGGSSGSSSSSTSKTELNPTHNVNPFTDVYTDQKGTTVKLQEGTALQKMYDYGNQELDKLLEEYRNPTLNSVTNQAKINEYNRVMGKQTQNALENEIINPLSRRNMIRSSQATNLYNGLNQSMVDNYSKFTNELLANSQKESQDMINSLYNWYLQGQNVVASDQAAALNAASGGATKSSSGNGSAA